MSYKTRFFLDAKVATNHPLREFYIKEAIKELSDAMRNDGLFKIEEVNHLTKNGKECKVEFIVEFDEEKLANIVGMEGRLKMLAELKEENRTAELYRAAIKAMHEYSSKAAEPSPDNSELDDPDENRK